MKREGLGCSMAIERLPKGPSRNFLEALGKTKAEPADHFGQKKSMKEAEGNLRRLIDERNARFGKPVKLTAKRNEEIRSIAIEVYGDESIYTMLPSDFSLFQQFSNRLQELNLQTKSQLVKETTLELGELPGFGTGTVGLNFLIALRNLAIAQREARS